MNSNHDLCSDIIFEILSRSSLETLGRCRLLSKEYNSLTYESTFMNLHSQRNNIISGYFLQTPAKTKYSTTFVPDNSKSLPKLSLKFLPGTVKIEASTNQGVLLCSDHITKRIPKYYVCKPSTQQWLRIPNPKTRYSNEAMGMIVLRSNPLHYKIVRFSRPKFRDSRSFYQYHFLRCEVFDSEVWTWKQLEEVNLANDESLGFAPAVSACGSLHWLTYNRNIFAFHENKESYSLISLPHLVYEKDRYKYHVKLLEYEGKLALMCMGRQESFMELWVMENYGKKLWNMRPIMSIEALTREVPYPIPISFYNTDVALMMEYYMAIFFNYKDRSTNIVRLENYFDDYGIFPLRSDFEPSNLMADQEIKKLGPSRGKSKQSKSKPRELPSKCIVGFRRHFTSSRAIAFLILLFALTFVLF